MNDWYKQDLAYIHDVGFRSYVVRSLPGILAILAEHQICEGLVVDLGCGSGLSAQALTQSGYQVLGVDISQSMINIARERVPAAEFRVDSLFAVEMPNCHAVISIGECFNYLFDADHDDQSLTDLFHRIYTVLVPGGILIFDIAEPGQVPYKGTSRGFTEGEDWIVLVEKDEDLSQAILTRRIISLRKVGDYYRRDDETHRQRLYLAAVIAKNLEQVGFQVEIKRSYGDYTLPNAHAAFVARKLIT